MLDEMWGRGLIVILFAAAMVVAAQVSINPLF